eukprot:XP_017177919.1 PREDICTED: synaptogyrin-4 isoform X2 [Mus musculus]
MHLPESLHDLADNETVRFLRRPKSISRIFGGVFSLVIFSSLLTDGYQNRTESPQLRCVLNSNHMACSFAVGAGFLSFLSCLVFLAIDAYERRLVGTRFKIAFQLLDFILADGLALQPYSKRQFRDEQSRTCRRHALVFFQTSVQTSKQKDH